MANGCFLTVHTWSPILPRFCAEAPTDVDVEEGTIRSPRPPAARDIRAVSPGGTLVPGPEAPAAPSQVSHQHVQVGKIQFRSTNRTIP